MIKTKYTEDFEKLWNTFNSKYGNKGSKPDAFKRFKKLKVDSEDLEMLCAAVRSQIAEREEKDRLGVWMENFKHVCSWLNSASWENEIYIPTKQECNQRGYSNDRSTNEYRAEAKLSVVDRVKRAAEERECARQRREREIEIEEREDNRSFVGSPPRDIRPQAPQSIRGDDTEDMGNVIEGSFSRTD